MSNRVPDTKGVLTFGHLFHFLDSSNINNIVRHVLFFSSTFLILYKIVEAGLLSSMGNRALDTIGKFNTPALLYEGC